MGSKNLKTSQQKNEFDELLNFESSKMFMQVLTKRN